MILWGVETGPVGMVSLLLFTAGAVYVAAQVALLLFYVACMIVDETARWFGQAVGRWIRERAARHRDRRKPRYVDGRGRKIESWTVTWRNGHGEPRSRTFTDVDAADWCAYGMRDLGYTEVQVHSHSTRNPTA